MFPSTHLVGNFSPRMAERTNAQVLGWSGVGQLLFQFFVYPALCKTIGIVWLIRGSGVLAAASFIFVPDIQRANWSENGSCVLGAAVVIFLGSCISVVRYGTL